MTPEQATEIREHLINELNANGFNDIVTEVNNRLVENCEEMDFERTPRYLLTFFLSESISVIEGLSNKNFDKLLNKFNEFIKGNNRIESISVELLSQGKSAYFNLKDLPDYKDIIETFLSILNQIHNEN